MLINNKRKCSVTEEKEIFKPLGEMNFSLGNVTGNWTKWHQKFMNFLITFKKFGKDDIPKTSILLNLRDGKGYLYLQHVRIKKKKKFDKVVKEFEEYLMST